VVNNTRGRPRGRPDTRAAIVRAARDRFLADGYARTSVRAVARDAGVDHALVNYYFGSKQGLFGDVMALTLTPTLVLDAVVARGGPGVPEAVLTSLLTVWDDPVHRIPLLTMMSEATTNPQVREAVCGYLERDVFGRVAEMIGGRESRDLSAGVATILSGVVFARYLLGIEPLASMTPSQVVRVIAPALRATLQVGSGHRGRPRPVSARPAGTPPPDSGSQ
jgi:AcrR family transcriptional regulator